MTSSNPDAASHATIAEALAAILDRVEQATLAAGRASHSVSLVAVSKTHPSCLVDAAICAGQRVFGENKVQEAQRKFTELRSGRPDVRLHLIGPLQTNKALDAVRIADVIETLDRPRLVDAIEHAAQKAGRLPRLLVQINIGAEPQKAGILPDDADRFIDDCRHRFGDAVEGLMAIPPAHDDPSPFFRSLATMASVHGLRTLSMGMSGDFEQAIACGATSVRVGSAIFGTRPAGLPGDALASPTG